MTNKDIVIFIISYNRLSYLKSLVGWLEKAGFEHIHIVDNCSTYPPLLEYLQSSCHTVHRLEKNYGHLAVWKSSHFDEIISNRPYIVTDCDILPIAECPMDVTRYFSEILERFPNITKVGFSLKIDDLPEHFSFHNIVINWEKQFWKNPIGEKLFYAPIDTTFALYRPRIFPSERRWWKSIRTNYPYTARHLPWYSDTSHLGEEDIYYQKTVKNRSSFWSVTDEELLKKYNAELIQELESLHATRKWAALRSAHQICKLFFPKIRLSHKLRRECDLANNTSDIITLQKANERILVEISSITSSIVWKSLSNIEELFHKITISINK